LPDPAATDRALLERLRAGEQQAFEAIFRAHYAQLVGVAEAILRGRAQAEDAAQDVMLELWRRRQEIVLTTSLRAYLVRATRNRALNQIRHRRTIERARLDAVGPTAAPAADQDLAEQELLAAAERAVRDLPERCREVFELSRVHGLTYGEIAQVLSISVKTVETQMGKAIRVMRDRLAAWLS
jgi:RNA polymerase sigma-70 factor (ECF subfamily)